MGDRRGSTAAKPPDRPPIPGPRRSTAETPGSGRRRAAPRARKSGRPTLPRDRRPDHVDDRTPDPRRSTNGPRPRPRSDRDERGGSIDPRTPAETPRPRPPDHVDRRTPDGPPIWTVHRIRSRGSPKRSDRAGKGHTRRPTDRADGWIRTVGSDRWIRSAKEPHGKV